MEAYRVTVGGGAYIGLRARAMSNISVDNTKHTFASLLASRFSDRHLIYNTCSHQ